MRKSIDFLKTLHGTWCRVFGTKPSNVMYDIFKSYDPSLSSLFGSLFSAQAGLISCLKLFHWNVMCVYPTISIHMYSRDGTRKCKEQHGLQLEEIMVDDWVDARVQKHHYVCPVWNQNSVISHIAEWRHFRSYLKFLNLTNLFRCLNQAWMTSRFLSRRKII